MKRNTLPVIVVTAISLAAVLFALTACRNSGPGLPGGITITFTDTDMGSGELGGTVTVNRAVDESQITRYVIYWGKEGNLKVEGLPAIGEVAVTEADIVIEIPQNTVIPAGATHILAFVKDGDEESTESGSAAIVDLGSTVTVALNHSLSDVGSFGITVSGEDMDPVSDSGDASTTQFVVEVPDGTERTFEVTANISSSSTSAALAFTGSSVTDLTAGQPASVSVTVDQLSKTKIVIPDPENSRYRLVQIDDMSGAGWTKLQGTDLGWGSNYDFQPFDVDFDNEGRIYIANNITSGGHGRIIRINDISGAGVYEYTNVNSQIRCLAVDRVNEILYYSDGSTLWKCSLDGTGNTTLDVTGISSIRGLAVDGNGKLFISRAGTSVDLIFRYNPSTESIEKSYGSADTNMATAWDVLANGGSIFVANYQGSSGYLIMEFDSELNYVDSFGDQAGDPENPTQDEFLGPHRFVAIVNRKITVIDEFDDMDVNDVERLVSIDNLSGSGWDTFDPSEVEQSAFGFFEYY